MIHFFFFFNDTATTEIYTLSLHDALPIYQHGGDADRERDAAAIEHPREEVLAEVVGAERVRPRRGPELGDRKSTRLNSSHSQISYAVFCLKKKKEPHSSSSLSCK